MVESRVVGGGIEPGRWLDIGQHDILKMLAQVPASGAQLQR